MSGQEKGTDAEQRKTLKKIVAELRIGDDGGKPAYRIGRADKVEISMPSGQPIRSMVIEEVHISELADWIEAAAKWEGGNAAAMREALVQCELFLGNVSRHGHPTLNPGDKCTACDGVDELRGMVVRALSSPPRQCDVGSALEQYRRWIQFCEQRLHRCDKCPCNSPEGCTFVFQNMPYKAKKGGAS